MAMQNPQISHIIVMAHAKQYPFQAEVGVQLLSSLEHAVNKL